MGCGARDDVGVAGRIRTGDRPLDKRLLCQAELRPLATPSMAPATSRSHTAAGRGHRFVAASQFVLVGAALPPFRGVLEPGAPPSLRELMGAGLSLSGGALVTAWSASSNRSSPLCELGSGNKKGRPLGRPRWELRMSSPRTSGATSQRGSGYRAWRGTAALCGRASTLCGG